MQLEPTMPGDQKEDMILLYKNAQEWARHYQSLLMQLNTWVTTFNAAIITFVVTSYFHSPQRPVGMFYSLILPIGMSVVVIVASHKIDNSMREAFLRIVQIEDLLGLFDLKARNGVALLPEHLRQSPIKRWPQIDVWLVVNVVVILVCGVLFLIFYADASSLFRS